MGYSQDWPRRWIFFVENCKSSKANCEVRLIETQDRKTKGARLQKRRDR
jgi:hypothetical protein